MQRYDSLEEALNTSMNLVPMYLPKCYKIAEREGWAVLAV
jgi:hypothetical protein